MNSNKVEFNDGKIIVHKKEVVKDLHGKLSEEDIRISEEIISNNHKERELLIDILTGAHCNLCSESAKQQYPNKSAPYGNMSADIVFVNKMPSVLECATMLTHSDTAGHVLKLILSKLNLKISDLYFTDLIKCSNKILEESCYTCIHNYFLKEIYHVKPKAIVFQGLTAMNILYKAGILLNAPEVIEYGKIYDSYIISKDNPVKVMGIYDLNMVLEKEDEKLKECKKTVWDNLTSIVNAIKV